jgi:hypothetical protein
MEVACCPGCVPLAVLRSRKGNANEQHNDDLR